MREPKLIKVKRKGTIPRWRIRAAVKAVFSREIPEGETIDAKSNIKKAKKR